MQILFSVLTALVILAAIPVVFAADASVTLASWPPALKLPAGARPTRYAVTLTVVPGDAKVPGEIAIDIELDQPHRTLWLNADSLNVTRARVDASETHVSVLSGHDQFVGLAFEPALSAGSHRVILAFEAEQSRNSTRGVFALQDNGE